MEIPQTGLQLQKIFEELFPMRGHDGLRVELDTLNWKIPMTQSHDQSISRRGRDLQTLRQGFAFHHQRMITRRQETIGQTTKDSPIVMTDFACLPMHEVRGRDDPTAENLANRLVAKANTQNRLLGFKGLDDSQRDPRLIRGPRPRRDHNSFRVQLGDSSNIDLVIPENFDVLSQFAQVLDKIVGKGIVIIDHQNHFRTSKPSLGHFHGFNQSSRLVDGLLKFLFRDRIGNNSAAGLDVSLSILDNQGADRNA